MLGAVFTNFMGKDLKDDPVYQERLAKGLVKQSSGSAGPRTLLPGAKLSVLIFGLAILCVVFYATAISPTVGLIKKPIMARDHAIITFMLAAASLIAWLCKVKTNNIVNAATFKSGMSACICVLGVAWLGDHIRLGAPQGNQHPGGRPAGLQAMDARRRPFLCRNAPLFPGCYRQGPHARCPGAGSRSLYPPWRRFPA